MALVQPVLHDLQHERMKAKGRAEVEFDGFESGRCFAAEAFEVSCDVRAGAEKVWHHQDVVCSGVDALTGAIGDRWFGKFEITGHDDFVVALFSQSVGDDDEVVVGFCSATSVGDQQYGSCHWASHFFSRSGSA